MGQEQRESQRHGTRRGKGTPMPTQAQGFARDPDDKDGRPGLDLRPPTMDPSMLDLFRKAFDGPGIAWLWECSYPRTIHHTLWAMEQAKGYSASGLGDDAVLQMPAIVDDDVAFLNRFLAGALPSFPPHSSSISIAFKHLKLAMCRANQSCYATALANAANVNVHAAPVGTYAEYDTSGDMLMNVFRNFTAHFTFYKNYLGFSFDPENRRYAVYTPRPHLPCARAIACALCSDRRGQELPAGPHSHRIMTGYPVHRRANASTAMLMARNVHTSTRSPGAGSDGFMNISPVSTSGRQPLSRDIGCYGERTSSGRDNRTFGA